MKKYIIYLLLVLFIITPFSQVLAYGTNYRYTGQEMDSSSNLYYYGQRHYQPEVGRFTQPDPISKYLNNPQKLKQSTGQDLQKFLENPQALNEYGYTQNNPVKYTDPDGESPVAGAAVGVGVSTVWASPNIYNAGNAIVHGNLPEASKQSSIFLNKTTIGLVGGALIGLGVKVISSILGLGTTALPVIQNVNKLEQYTERYGSKIADKMNQALEVFNKNGIDISDHALYRTVTRVDRGVTIDKVINAFKEGVKYYDTDYNNSTFFKDGVRIAVEAGKIITVVTQKTMDNIDRFIKF